MKVHFTQALLLVLWWLLPTGIQAQVTNGDFETQRATAPQGLYNVAGSYQAYDDLPGWQAVTNPAGPAAGTASYMATNATNPLVNPQGSPFRFGGATFLPHSGRGCVVIQREAYAYTRDQFITQQVALSVNHIYQASFYVLRNPSAASYEQLLFAVSSTAPTGFTAGNNNSQYQNLNPTPYASFTSNPITSALTWELVTGTFVAQTSSSYITIGYGPTFGQLDPSGIGILTYAIDDVSLVDMGCIPMPIISRYGGLPNDCYRVDRFKIENYDPTLTYTVNNVHDATPVPLHPTSAFFRVGGSFNSNYTEYGSFTVTATNSCSSVTTEEIQAIYPCSELANDRTTKAAVAYPNPASEAINTPEGGEGAILLNDKGKILRKADTSGKLDVQYLPDGLYNLQMMQDGKLINQRIQVKH